VPAESARLHRESGLADQSAPLSECWGERSLPRPRSFSLDASKVSCVKHHLRAVALAEPAPGPNVCASARQALLPGLDRKPIHQDISPANRKNSPDLIPANTASDSGPVSTSRMYAVVSKVTIGQSPIMHYPSSLVSFDFTLLANCPFLEFLVTGCRGPRYVEPST